MQATYSPSAVEQRAQNAWSSSCAYDVRESLTSQPFYCLSMLPYPSGALHMGHVRNYTIGDVISRQKRLQGYHVLQPMGWDAFGLPAENAAIKHGVSPLDWTRDNIAAMKQQLTAMGFAYDWSRELRTCDPTYYRWNQWLFLQMLQRGLAYRKLSTVNWDPVDQTVLANEQVIDGKGWRSGAPVEQRSIPQWFFKITAYADELLAGLNTLEGQWPDQVLTMQRHWIGRSQGAVIDFRCPDAPTTHHTLSAFTTRPDTLEGVTFLALSASHPLSLHVAESNQDVAEFVESCKQQSTAEADLQTQPKRGISTGLDVVHPITGLPLPLWVVNYVVMDYGTGVVMGVPAHDARDHAFALAHQLPIIPVIAPEDGQPWDTQAAPFTDAGRMIDHTNTGVARPWYGRHNLEAQALVRELGASEGWARSHTQYRLRDWGISRQRCWGTPIPIIHCPRCGTVPVPEEDLPVLLPTDLTLTEGENPLHHPSFKQTTCPKCDGDAERETDTMDTFVDSSWYYARYTCPEQAQAMLDDRAKYWTPVNQYVGGIEHATMHLLYARFVHKVLRDLKLLHSDEPFERLLTQGMVLKDGSKMSKSKGNVVPPSDLLERYGADTLRLFMMFSAPPEQHLEWQAGGVDGAFRFLKRLWSHAARHVSTVQHAQTHRHADQSASDALRLAHDAKSLSDAQTTLRRTVHTHAQQALQDFDRHHFNTVVSGCMKLFNALEAWTADNVSEHSEALNTHTACCVDEAYRTLLRLLYPITPHLCTVVWQAFYGEHSLEAAGWPEVDPSALVTDQVDWVFQVQGKKRGMLTCPSNASSQAVEELARHSSMLQRANPEGRPIRKVVVVPGRLINVVLG